MRQMIVGNWPKPESNQFVRRFCEALECVDVTVKAFSHPIEAIFERLDVLQIHWPEQVLWGNGRSKSLYLAFLTILALSLLKARGVKLVWCAHNLEPHDTQGAALRVFWRLYLGTIALLLDGFLTLSPSTVQIVRNRVPALRKKPGDFFWHPAYAIEPRGFSRSAWRARHNIADRNVLLCFLGSIKPYKGVEEMVDVFLRTRAPELRLVIAGTPAPECAEFLNRAAKDDNRITLKLGYPTDDEFSQIVLASDLAVLPFKKIFHSGSMIYALSCGKAVVTPATPYASDLRATLGPEWIRTYHGEFTEDLFFQTSAEDRPDLSFLSDDKIGSKLRQFYQSLLNKTSVVPIGDG